MSPVRIVRRWRGAKCSIWAKNWISNIRSKRVYGIQAVIWPQINSFIRWDCSSINGYRHTSLTFWCSALASHDCTFIISIMLSSTRDNIHDVFVFIFQLASRTNTYLYGVGGSAILYHAPMGFPNREVLCRVWRAECARSGNVMQSTCSYLWMNNINRLVCALTDSIWTLIRFHTKNIWSEPFWADDNFVWRNHCLRCRRQDVKWKCKYFCSQQCSACRWALSNDVTTTFRLISGCTRSMSSERLYCMDFCCGHFYRWPDCGPIWTAYSRNHKVSWRKHRRSMAVPLQSKTNKINF